MSKFRDLRWWHWTPVAAIAIAVTGWLGAGHLHSSPAKPPVHETVAEKPPANLLAVETVHPVKGGLKRATSQPGSAHSFESAELYAKISGFLKELHVDIGSRVKRGDLLAEIDVPELAEDLESAVAALLQAQAEVVQAEARVESAVADHKSAESRVAQMKADVERSQAEVSFAQKQFDRISDLNELKGIEDRVVDERKFQLESAQASFRSTESTVLAAQQQAHAAASRIGLAKAELQVAKARVTVAESQRDRAKVMVSYTRITSPYDGVVTLRNFHRGAYVRSPDHGGQTPLLAVDRVDLMRVLVRVPERDVPYVEPGDTATIHFDALPQRKFTGKVARIAESEDPATRTMLAEIDLPNPDGIIRDHMYGRVDIALEDRHVGVVVPSTCLVGDVAAGQARLFVVSGDTATLRQVEVGKDTGIEVEVLSGVSPDEQVVLRPSGSLADGMKVAGTLKAAAAKTH
jgi:HlyD family secretion protein